MGETGSIRALADAAAAWLLTYGIHSTALLGAAWLASRGVWADERTREMLWKLALAGALATATIAQLRPGASALHVAPVPAATANPAVAMERSLAAGGGLPGIAPAVDPASEAADGVRWTEIGVLAWLVGAAVALGRFGAGWLRFTRRLARTPVREDHALAVALREMCAAAGVRRRIRLTCSDALASPVAVLRGEICVPRGTASRLDGEQQRAMLAHETAHLLRRDPLWLCAAGALASVFWFQPLLRLCVRRLRETAEYQCDAWAARHAGPFALARCLAEVASWPASRPYPAAAAAMSAGGAHLVRRVERLLAGAPEPRGAHRWTAAALLATFAAAAWAPAVSAGPLPPMTAAPQQSYAARFGISPELAGAVERAARAEGVDAELAFRLVRTESRFDERKEGPGGIGLTQIILPTARRLQPGITRGQLFERDTNLRLGLRYLHAMLVRYHGDATRAVQAYYQGPRQLDHAGPHPGTRAYAAGLLGPVAGLPAYRGPGLRSGR
ncbi:M56 family metallopeptidase [Longimicrobium sp.]|uniref:M56 family metallopeptidase n=1 Tax=Longimicrobium sp. TaxID=2029185 RepID=UPI002CC6A19E|nr:M56 family metallopeptidase [Longimicrobium sp.]HSU17953.1 M56 family metallopeptidase [Longimicrobium sp.]